MDTMATAIVFLVYVGLTSGQQFGGFGIPPRTGLFQGGGGGDVFGFQGGMDTSGGWDLFGDTQGGQNPLGTAFYPNVNQFDGQGTSDQTFGQGMAGQLSRQTFGSQQGLITPGNTNPITDFGDQSANQGGMTLGGGVGMPGGTFQANVNAPEIIESAQFAVSQLGNEYDLVQIVQATQQVVSGMLYGMTIIVNRNDFFVMDSLTCEVVVHHVPWEGTRYLRSSNCVSN